MQKPKMSYLKVIESDTFAFLRRTFFFFAILYTINARTKLKAQQRENRKNQTEILQLKNTMNTLNNAKESFNNRLEQAKERIRKLKARSIEII